VKALCLAYPGNRELAARLGLELGALELRRFPDGESYVRLGAEVAGREAVIVCTLDRPDAKALRLVFLAHGARDLGAARVGLVAPYLAYLRQDRRFEAGEGVTSVYFARLLGATFDWLVTVDPHLHRHRSLADLYAVPTRTVHAAPALAAWVRRQVAQPLLVGPDAESRQWVERVAADAGAPVVVLDKVRRGDREVAITAPDLGRWRGRTPVVLDDVVSTGTTVLAAMAALRAQGFEPPIVLAVHAVFARGAWSRLRTAGAGRVVTTNTIVHPSNAIDVGDLVAAAVQEVRQRDG
jgi:ribose-phosphate pyrophosphokinase